MTGKYLDENGKYLLDKSKIPDGSRHKVFTSFMDRFCRPNSIKAVEAYAQIAKKYGVSLTELSLAFCLSRWYATSTLIGATTMEQLKEDILPFLEDATPLPKEALEDIDEVHIKNLHPICKLN